MNCQYCRIDPKLKIAWGCEKPAQAIVWKEGENDFYSCPWNFVPENVCQWYDKYLYTKLYPNAVNCSYENQSAKFWEAVRFYEEVLIQQQKENTPSKFNGLKKLKAGLHGKQ